MITIKVKDSVDVEISYPDHYGFDNSRAGQAVDALIKLNYGKRSEHNSPRARLVSNDASTVRCAISEIDQLYAMVEAVLSVETQPITFMNCQPVLPVEAAEKALDDLKITDDKHPLRIILNHAKQTNDKLYGR